MNNQNLEQQAITAIRMLSAEGVQAANSGHPGLPLGAAAMAYTLWAKHLKFNAGNPAFFDRDRFVLSAGHGSILQYSLLHLFGYDLGKEDLMNFRQAGSRAPGHPEYGHTPGVETTTGPLGQGIANAVGMAIAETMLAAKFNREGFPVADHYTYALCGDGCMMEGIENEAASLAGTLKLGKLIVLYDSNNITIEGGTDIAFREDVPARHKALGWNIIKVSDGNDVDAVDKAIRKAKKSDKPTLIEVKTVIGFGSPMAGSHECHGAPLGRDNIEKMRASAGWTAAPFEVPGEIKAFYKKITDKKKKAETAWNKMIKAYAAAHPALYKEFKEWTEGKFAAGGASDGSFGDLYEFSAMYDFPDKPEATRNCGGVVLNRFADFFPNLVGGSADLAPSNKSHMKGKGDYSAENRAGRNMHFGIREHAMSAVCNGIALHGGLRAYCATFFVFSDYMKNAMRLSGLMDLPVLYVLTHDSIGVGEDGPTHQPVEQLISLRSIPNMKVFRPCDGRETAAAYIAAFTMRGPTAVALSRQNLPPMQYSGPDALKGAYVLSDSEKGTPDCLLMASGSEVHLLAAAQEELKKRGVDARVISVPCMELFDRQDAAYKEQVMPSNVRRRVAVEAGSSYSWHKYTGLDGKVVGIDTFGASAPAEGLFVKYGITVENVVEETLRTGKA
ncbi:MAG: transketolase [Clostridiales bacterium]|jgi:transketolase|nr:transketolase [Clostridiales bacterium]